MDSKQALLNLIDWLIAESAVLESQTADAIAVMQATSTNDVEKFTAAVAICRELIGKREWNTRVMKKLTELMKEVTG